MPQNTGTCLEIGLKYKTDFYGGNGSYTEAASPKCGGVGWVRCSFCFGDGTILVLE